jgi:FKBP-type peptidyl-prolyl isomerase-like protein
MRRLPRLRLAFVFLWVLVAAVACGSNSGYGGNSSPAGVTSTAGSSTVTARTTPATTGTGGANLFDMAIATTTPSGLKYIDSVVGAGDQPRSNQSVTVNYTGKLASDGKVFDSSIGRGPATFALTQVIPGFSEGILTMRPGGKRTIYIPAPLAYGANPPPGSGIQPNADLIFEIELISVR